MKRRSRHAVALTALATLMPVGALTGCEKVNTVASSVSPCFRVLPLAHAAVGEQGSFVDVARVRGRIFPGLPRIGPRRTTSTLPATTTPSTQRRQPDSCVVGYRGTFDPRRMQRFTGTERTGPYAIVIISVRTRTVRATFLSQTLPRPLHSL